MKNKSSVYKVQMFKIVYETMKNRNFILLFVALFVASCGEKKGFNGLFDEVCHVELNKYDETLTSVMRSPSAFCVVDSCFVFVEPKLDDWLTIYDGKTGQSVQLLHRGQGDIEALDVQTIAKGKRVGEIYALDVLSKKLFVVDVENKLLSVDKDYSLRNDSLSVQSIVYDDSVSIYETQGRERHFVIDDNVGRREFGNLNFSSEIDAVTMSNTASGYCVGLNSMDRFVWASMFGDIFEIYDYSRPDDIKVVKSNVVRVPKMDLQGLLMSDANIGVVSLTASEENIYMLYSGKTFNLFSGFSDLEELKASKNILVFDWNGNPIKSIQFDKDVLYISYDKNAERLYCLGINEDGEYRLYYVENLVER